MISVLFWYGAMMSAIVGTALYFVAKIDAPG